jgi:hypothetical protein
MNQFFKILYIFFIYILTKHRGHQGSWCRDLAVQIPQIFPGLVLFPEEHIALNEAAVPVDLWMGFGNSAIPMAFFGGKNLRFQFDAGIIILRF